MPIVLDRDTDKSIDSPPPAHDLESTARPTRSRRTLSTGSLHRLKKEVGASFKQQQQHGQQQQQPQQRKHLDDRDHDSDTESDSSDEKHPFLYSSSSPQFPSELVQERSDGGWQNSIHSLSLNTKVDRTQGEPDSVCIMASRENAKNLCQQAPCRNRSGLKADSLSADPATSLTAATVRSKGAFLPKLDCMTISSSMGPVSSNTISFLESAPSPAASEDAEDLKSPRRSGRARRPPRPKEAEELIGHARQSSLTVAPLSTPPASPAPHAHEREVSPIAAPPRKRAGSVKTEKIAHVSVVSAVTNDATDMTSGGSESSVVTTDSKQFEATSVSALPPIGRKTNQDLDLASIPGVVTTQRVRRPPQNLAEFVSSEDFKAAPCGKRQERTPQSQSLASSSVPEASSREKKEGKRTKSECQLSGSNHAKRASSAEGDHEFVTARQQQQQQQQQQEQQQQGGPGRSRSMSDLGELSHRTNPKDSTQPATIPLSALSHAKRRSQDFTLMNSKKQRREGSGRSRPLINKRHSSHHIPSREEILERRRRDGKREIMVASDDDWSDSDFDFLRDEQENYRLMRIRARKTQGGRGRWSLRDELHEGGNDEMGDDGYGSEGEERCRAEGEKIKLLMDPSVINYGFDSCDGEYILDYHQGPLFNNVTWPEFSDVKEVNGGNGNINGSNSGNNNPGNISSNLSGSGNPKSVYSDSEKIDGNNGLLQGTVADGLLLPAPATETVHDMDLNIVAQVVSALVGPAEPSLADVEVAEIVSTVNPGDGAEAPVQMEGIEVYAVHGGVKDEIEAEGFIGWSLCE